MFSPFGIRKIEMKFHWFGDQVSDPHSGVERAPRILKHHLHVTPQEPHSAFGDMRDVLSIEGDLALGRFGQPQDGAPDGGFARTAFPNHAQRFAGRDAEVDAIDGIDESAAACGENV